MNYNFTLIKTKDDCLKLIATAKAEKENLEFRKSVLEHRVKTSSDNAVEIETDLQTINGQVSVSESIINSLPDGGSQIQRADQTAGTGIQKGRFGTTQEQQGRYVHPGNRV